MAEADISGESPFLHDAFISYSRKDTPFAAAVERSLKRYSPPKDLPAPQRRLNIFRDAEDFTGTEYFASVEKHLQGSRKLIVICSPNSRGSDFVNDEIRRFASSHDPADIISILIAGIPNNEAKFNDQSEMAFPTALVERLEVPLASDYRGFNPKSDNPTAGNYRQAWFKLLADIYGCSRAEVEQREQRRRVRQRIQWTAASAVIALALGVALYIADYQRRTAKSNELADQAIQLADGDPEHALKLARDAVDQSASVLSASALRVALAKMPDLLIPLSFPAPAQEGDYRDPAASDLAPDGRHIAIADAQPRILDLETGRTVVKIESQGAPITGLLYSPDGAWLAAIDEKHNTIVFDSATGKSRTNIRGELHWRQPGAGGARQAVILSDKSVQFGELDNSGSWHPRGELTPRDYVEPAREPYDSSSRELSPDGHRIASLAAQGDAARLSVTDLDSGQAVSGEFQSPAGLNKLSWSPNGSYIVAASLFGLVVVDSHTLRSLLHQDSGNEITVEDVSFSGNEKLLASTDRNGTTTLWDLETGKKAAILSGSYAARAYQPIFSSSGGLVSVSYSDSRVFLFTTDDAAPDFESSTEPMAKFDPIWGGTKAVKFTRDGGALIIEYENNKLAIWKTQRWRPERRLHLKYEAGYNAGKAEGLRDIRMAADNSAIGVRSAGAWRGWSVISGDEVSVNGDVLKPLDKVTLSEAGDWQLRNSMSDETTIDLVNRSTTRQRYPLKHNATVMSKTFSPDGNCILTTSRFYMASGGPPESADVARLWDTETGKLLREWEFGYGNPDSAFFAGRDRFIVLSAGEGFIYRTPLCGSLDELNQVAMPSNSSQVSADTLVNSGLGKPTVPSSPPEPPPAPEIPAPTQEAPASASVKELPSPLADGVKETPAPNAPSFSCGGKLSPVEVLICKDNGLAKLDVDLAGVYRKKLKDLQGQDRQQLIREQRAWIKVRSNCVKKGDLKQCVEDAFRRRLAALDSRQ